MPTWFRTWHYECDRPAMNDQGKMDLNRRIHRFERRLPARLRRFVRWLRQPSSGLVRIPLAGVLIVGGFAGFLPILGFWMIPLGLLLLAQDVRFLRGPLARLLAWIDAKWPAPKKAPQRNSRSTSD